MMMDKNARGDNGVPVEVLKCIGRIHSVMTETINNTYETGEWFQDFIEVTMVS
jgi:hypothetical protein